LLAAAIFFTLKSTFFIPAVQASGGINSVAVRTDWQVGESVPADSQRRSAYAAHGPLVARSALADVLLDAVVPLAGFLQLAAPRPTTTESTSDQPAVRKGRLRRKFARMMGSFRWLGFMEQRARAAEAVAEEPTL
jgi:hypothetical protein